MSQISSINFKKSFEINTQHNDRTLAPNYLISGVGCEVNRNHQEALKLKNEMIDSAIKAYQNKVKQKFKAKSFEWSAVVNIKSDSTMKDLENLSKFLEEKYKFQCYQIAIHRDEGHFENGKKVINHHAHLEFITLDKNTGKNAYRRAYITPTKLRQMQTEVAEILRMERGVDKRLSGAKRVEPRLFAKIKEQERKQQEALKLEIAQNKKETQNLTTKIKALNAKNEALKTQVKDLKSANELLEKNKNTQITTLQNDLKQEKEKKKKALEELEKLRKESKNKGLPKKYFQGINQLKKLIGNYIEFDKSYESFQNQWKDYNEVTKEIFEDLIYFNDKILDLDEEIESLQQKNKDLTAENNELKKESNELKSKLDEKHLTNIDSQLARTRALKEQLMNSKNTQSDLDSYINIFELKSNKNWTTALVYCRQILPNSEVCGNVRDFFPYMRKYQDEALKNKDSIKQEHLDKAEIMINNHINNLYKEMKNHAIKYDKSYSHR